MSGSSKVEVTSTYFHLSSESACMNFEFNPDDPDYEMRWHRGWKEKGDAWIERVKPILEQRFEWLAAQPDPDWPIVKYDPRHSLCLGFVGMGGPGMTQVTVSFSAMPSDAARERLRQELVKDVAIVEGS